MKKTILGGLVASFLTFMPTMAISSPLHPTQQQTSHAQHPPIQEEITQQALKRISLLIKNIDKDLSNIEKNLDRFFEKRKTQKANFKIDDKIKIIDDQMQKFSDVEDKFEEIIYIEKLLPQQLIDENNKNGIKVSHVNQKLLAAFLQVMADEIESGLDFKVSGERNQTLMVMGEKAVNMNANELSQDLRLTMLHMGFEDILFIDFKNHYSLEEIIVK